MAVRGYDVLNLDEYMESFNDVSAAPERLIRRVVQSVATNALKTLFPLDMLGESGGPQPFSHIFAPTSGAEQALVYYTDIRFLVPTSIDKLRSITGAQGADRGRMREAFANMTERTQ